MSVKKYMDGENTKTTFNSSASDVVEVVRCKDCKHWRGGDCFRIELTKPSDFCSYGERIGERTSDI